MPRPKGTPKTGGGTRKGVPNKMTKALKEMILGALDDAGGQDYLRLQASLNPAAFLSLIGKVLPVTLNGDPKEPLSIEIVRRIVHVNQKTPGN